MTQSKAHSFLESLTNILAGSIVSIVFTTLAFSSDYLRDHYTVTEISFMLTVFLTFTSLLRSYFVRRWFNNMASPSLRSKSFDSLKYVSTYATFATPPEKGK